MRQLLFLTLICSSICACSDDDKGTIGFSKEELSPVVTFTYSKKRLAMSNTNSGLWTGGKAIDEYGQEIQGKSTRGFGSTIDSSGTNKFAVTITISRWVSPDEVDYVMPNGLFDVIKPDVFKSIFSAGKRLYAKNGYGITTTNEVLIEFFDENAIRWSSCYLGNYYSTPSYSELQPSSNFTITRSMPVGQDSIFVEAKFKARLYKSETSYYVINDGYFKGYFYRRPW
jgi:hypothetical protein